MPRPKKTGWDRVTITLSPDCIKALRQLNGLTGKEMGALADEAMRKGGLFESLSQHLNYQLGKTDTLPQGLSAKDIKPHAYALPEPPAATRKPKAQPAAPAASKTSQGSPELLAQLETLIPETFTQGDLAEAIGTTAPNFRSWRKLSTPWVPAKYIPGVEAFLKGKGIKPATEG